MQWLLLLGAILAEVVATVCLKLSDGFSKVVPTVLVAAGYITAFTLLTQVLKRGMPLGMVYGIWAASGVALVALVSAVIFHEPLSWVQIIGLVAVIIGVLALEMGGAH
ncbi:DMT family transporter [Nocardia sp. NPDC127526]|uniref:DMT family transporter n=1 Tax=Nocardia sp. NPDC127526 TaxID=3345393 RepID=UPI00363A51DA